MTPRSSGGDDAGSHTALDEAGVLLEVRNVLHEAPRESDAASTSLGQRLPGQAHDGDAAPQEGLQAHIERRDVPGDRIGERSLRLLERVPCQGNRGTGDADVQDRTRDRVQRGAEGQLPQRVKVDGVPAARVVEMAMPMKTLSRSFQSSARRLMISFVKDS